MLFKSILNKFNSLNPALYSFKVDVALHSQQSPSSWTISNIQVTNIYVHPSYNSSSVDNDLALLKIQVILF